MHTVATEDYIWLLYGSHLLVEWLGARMCDKTCGETGQTVQVNSE